MRNDEINFLFFPVMFKLSIKINMILLYKPIHYYNVKTCFALRLKGVKLINIWF